MTLRLFALMWFAVALFENFVSHNDGDANASCIISMMFWVGAEVVAAIKKHDAETMSPVPLGEQKTPNE